MELVKERWENMSSDERLALKKASQREFEEQAHAIQELGLSRAARRLVADDARESDVVPASTSASETPSVKFGCYCVEAGQAIGEGGYSKVVRARSPEGVLVAVKVCSHSDGVDAATEVAIYKQLPSNYNLELVFLPLLASSTSAPTPWLAFPFHTEGDLLEHLRQHRSVSGADLDAIVLQLTRGTQLLHDISIVHMDLKPNNLLWHPSTRHLRITDFGLSVFVDCTSGHYVGDVAGKAAGHYFYRAPELWPSTDARAWKWSADVWSCGCIIYEVAAGGPLMSQEAGRSTTGRRDVHQVISAWCDVWQPIFNDAALRAFPTRRAIRVPPLWRTLVWQCCAPLHSSRPKKIGDVAREAFGR